MPNVKFVVHNGNQHTKKKQVQEEHDVGMLMLYMMNLVLDDKERKKMHKEGSSLLKILVI
jgi:hypothetical protein